MSVDLPLILGCAKPEHLALMEGIFTAGKRINWNDRKFVKHYMCVYQSRIDIIFFDEQRHADEYPYVVLSVGKLHGPRDLPSESIIAEWRTINDNGIEESHDRMKWVNFEDPSFFDNIALYAKELIKKVL